jgi:ketosteroid isomerase-like protein
MTAFNTDEFVAQGETVVILGSESGIVRSTGQPFRNEWAQKYVVKDGLITRMVEYNIQVEPRA